jgi:GT2 family glycosyltransferase
MPKVAVVTLNWEKPDITIDTVNSFLKITHPNFTYKIFIVDNGSTDNSVEKFQILYQKEKNIEILKSLTNLGYVEGNNFGIKQVLNQDFDYLLLANNDILVDKYFLSKLVTVGENNKKVGIIGPKIYFAAGYEYHKDRYQKNDIGKIIWSAGGKIDWDNVFGQNIGIDEVDIGQYDKNNQKLDFLTGCCFLIKKEVFERIGLFDPTYFMYHEDTDFCQRAIKAGILLEYVADAKIWHLNSATAGAGGDLHHYFLTRNRLLFGMRYASFRTKISLLRESIVTFLKPKTPWRRKAVIDFYLGRFGKGSWQ